VTSFFPFPTVSPPAVLFFSAAFVDSAHRLRLSSPRAMPKPSGSDSRLLQNLVKAEKGALESYARLNFLVGLRLKFDSPCLF
jgi:hypothetical protein